jgi:hypothetical protein
LEEVLAEHPDHESDVGKKLHQILAAFQGRLIDDELIAEMTTQLNEKLANELGERCIRIERQSAALKAEVISKAMSDEWVPASEASYYDAVKAALAA